MADSDGGRRRKKVEDCPPTYRSWECVLARGCTSDCEERWDESISISEQADDEKSACAER